MALITVVGSINTDQVIALPALPRAGETVLGGDLRTFGGGKGANQATAATRLGGQVRMIGRIGADAFGADRRRELLDAGIDVGGIRVDPAAPSGVALILVDAGGENMIALAPGANAGLTPDKVAESWEPGTRVALAVLEVPLAAVEEAFRRARADGAETILNAAPPMELPRSLLDCVDHLIVNETEAELLSGIDAGDRAGAFAAAARLREGVSKSVIVTLGSDGAVLYTATGRHLPAFEIEAVDTTAAGDAFCGAFGLARARGTDLLECVRYASAAGALAATRAGAQPSLPTASEMEELLG
ncbi:MAG: ribokinase [Chloroflexota bacterium]|jgi:ribokinase|nr:ribokinase [Chloroflexota bacterium]MDP6509377.1 ribokinase [Chloroflexota bacterium]MDP6757431.1 ribokinase [Chloroflexota bacterium]